MWKHLEEKGVELPKITAMEISKQVEPVLRAVEEHGVLIDVGVLHDLDKRLGSKIKDLTSRIYHEAGQEFNINSPQQLSTVLFDKLHLPTKDLKRTKTGASTAASELQKLVDLNPVIEPILEYRELSKLSSTYLKPLPEMVDKYNRLHTTYGQETSTGRLTSANPNLQNIPVKGEWGEAIRTAFIAPAGSVLISADYSQVELRIVACLAQDLVMLKAFESGRDIHTATAAEIFNVPTDKVTSSQRRIAKTVNFGVLYGMSPYGLSEAVRISREKAASYIKRYFEIHQGIRQYCNDMIKQAREHGYTETLFGFRRQYQNIKSYNHTMAEAEERMAINAPVQGTAAEILKLAMIELYSKLNQTSIRQLADKHQNDKAKMQKESEGAKLILTVHDELVIETPKETAAEVAKLVEETMENAVKICVPLKVEVGAGKNWAEAKK